MNFKSTISSPSCTKSTKIRRWDGLKIIAWLLVTIFVFAIQVAQADPGTPSGKGVQPVEYFDNLTCGQIFPEMEGLVEFKVEPVETGTVGNNELSVSIAVNNGLKTFDWDQGSSFVTIWGIFVKGGGGGNLYSYAADGIDESNDTSLHAPLNHNGKYFGLSHISFCYMPGKKVEPPTITKTLISSNTHTEPGGAYNFTASFTNPNDSASIFLTSLVDEVDIFADGTYNVALDLWGALDVPAGDGVYLTASNCGALLSGGQIEIVSSGSFSCQFEVTIIDTDLPDDQSPEFYDDTVRLSLEDKNGDDVTNGETCPADLAGIAGKFCSNVLRVQVTNLPPDISVVKSADKDDVLEPGENVEFTIEVTNNSDAWDSPINLDSLNDSIYGNLNGTGDCAINVSIAQGATYSCSFTEFVAGDQGQSFTNTVTAVGSDNEGDTDTAQDSHTVLVLDVPSNIDLDKTANPTSVLETGDDTSIFRPVRFTFVISVDAAGVDDVTFSSLVDTEFGDITTECNFGTVAAPQLLLPGLILSPGASDSCFIDRGLQGYDEDTHFNKATVHGTDSDGAVLMAMDDATVEFDPSAPASDMEFATSLLVVLVMHNAGLENVNLSALTLQGNAIVDGMDYGQYTILNIDGGYHAGVFYPACNIGQALGYNGSATDTYSCAFTIELQPGIENADDINFFAPIGNGIIATFMNAAGADSSNAVGIQVLTDEP